MESSPPGVGANSSAGTYRFRSLAPIRIRSSKPPTNVPFRIPRPSGSAGQERCDEPRAMPSPEELALAVSLTPDPLSGAPEADPEVPPLEPTADESGHVQAGQTGSTASNFVPSHPAASMNAVSESDALRYDRRLMAINPLLLASRWDRVLEELADEEVLPPQLALIYAVATRETGDRDGEATPLAIQAMASLLSVPDTSAAAVVCAKRLVRSKPRLEDSRAKLAASSLGMIVFMLVTAAGVGFATSTLVGQLGL